MTFRTETAQVLPAPPETARFRTEIFPNPQRIDYAAHPAYARFFAEVGPRTRVTATLRFLKSLVSLTVKRLINYELIPNEVRMGRRSLGGRLKFGAVSLRNVFVRPSRRSGHVSLPIARTLLEQGCCVLSVSADQRAPLERATAPSFERLAAARAARTSGKREFDESRLYTDRRDERDLYDAAEQLLIDSGVLAAASEYLGRPARLVDANPQINDASDSFWRDVFPDAKDVRLPATAYFHRDASGGDLKAIIYMSNVGPENGPFSYVLGTHRLPMSRIDDFICEANDHNGFAHTEPETRRRFAGLPRKFQQKGSFGNDLSDGDPVSAEIVRATWAITAPKGSIVLFDTKGVHRGGMVEQGERRVVTCVIG